MPSLKARKDIAPPHAPRHLLALGLTLGVLADALWFRHGPGGPGFVLWALLAGAAAMYVVHHSPRPGLGEPVVWAGVGVLGALLMLLRSTPLVTLGLLLTMIVAAAMLLTQKNGRSLRDTALMEHLRSLFRVPTRALLAGFPVLLSPSAAGEPLPGSRDRLLRGFLLALPLLAVFSALFASADARVEAALTRLFAGVSPLAGEHLLASLLVGWCCTGLLAGVAQRHWQVQRLSAPLLRLGSRDTAALLGTVVLAFVGFIALQLPMLFGGAQALEAHAGLTVADYARRGFFELIAASLLALGVLVVVVEAGASPRVFRPLAAVLLACVALLLISALQRMALYVAQFGLSLDRLTALAVMAWLLWAGLLFSATLWRGTARDFASGLSIGGVLTVFVFALSNPAAIVSKTHVARAIEGRQTLDVPYLMRLGSDALPPLLTRFSALSDPDACRTAQALLSLPPGKYRAEDAGGWRGWNLSESRAARLLEQHRAQLNAKAETCAGSV